MVSISISKERCLFVDLHGDEFYIFIPWVGEWHCLSMAVERGRVLKTEGLVNLIQILV